MNRIFLSLGSNIQPAKYIPACFQKLKERFHVLKISPVYETTPVGPAGSFSFWNAVVEIETDLTGKNLSDALRSIEEALGRVRNPLNKFAPRTLDIDILPQPDYQNLAFIMIPLADISPDTLDPQTGKSFRELAQALAAEGKAFRKVQPSEFIS